MKFKKVLSSIGTLSKQDFYNFDFSQEQLDIAKNKTFDNPLLIYDKYGSITALYTENGELCLKFFISYYGFVQGFGKHEANEYGNIVRCSCGKTFTQGQKKNGMDKFNKHLEEINKLREEEGKK